MKAKDREKKEVSKSNFFIRAALLLFAVFCAVTVVKLQLEFNQLKSTKALLNTQIEETKDRIAELEVELDTVMDDDYVIAVAKEKLNLRLPEEIIFYNDLNN